MTYLLTSLFLTVCLIFLPHFMSGPYYVHVFIITMMNIILTSSLRLISLSGQISLAHGGMMTIGAYTSALLVMRLGLSTWYAMLIAGLFVALVACLTGFPFMRLKGIYFSIVTVFFSEMVVLITQQWESLTGGSGGIYNIPAPGAIVVTGLFNIDFLSKIHFYYFALFLMIASLLILYAIEKSRIGFILKGIKQTDSLAESIGINTIGFKVLAYSTGCFFAGIVGAFYSHYISAMCPDTFGFFYTINILVYMTVGGIEVFAGPILGAFVLTILPEITRVLKEFMPFIFAAVLIAVIFFLPEGLAGLFSRLIAFIKKIIRIKNA
ncbi:MAG: branched-chain amino acid ABC transporter permease [Spirochaetes bacterium]|nr:branched-chain amino acid ABC transporter permease [Spirochaetota bacterium]